MKNYGLYDKTYEHDSCGVGFVVNINGKPAHQIVKDGIEILKNLEHRGALGGDMKNGDGAGILVQIPHKFFVNVCKNEGFVIPDKGSYGVGFLFMPARKNERKKVENEIVTIVKNEGGTVLGWRDVPVNPKSLGETARKSMPFMKQVFVTYNGLIQDELERKLYILRRSIENKRSFLIPVFSF